MVVKRGARRVAAIASLLASGLASGGCVLVPLPAPPRTTKVVDAEMVRPIHPGISTRTDVLMMLGAPDFMNDARDLFIYSGTYEAAGVAAARFGAVPDVLRPSERVRVEIRFDDDARVLAVRIERTALPVGSRNP